MSYSMNTVPLRHKWQLEFLLERQYIQMTLWLCEVVFRHVLRAIFVQIITALPHLVILETQQMQSLRFSHNSDFIQQMKRFLLRITSWHCM